MADKSLDKRSQEIERMQVKKGNEYHVMSQAQNQFMAIQAERKNNLAQQRVMMGADQAQAANMMQAAHIAANPGGDAGIPQTVDPRTQAVMNKYGMGRPRFQKSSQHSQQVTKQNVTIHNTTNNNTTNNVNAGGGYGGPVQGRALKFRGGGNESAEKFKVWLANSYARQQQQANIRNREYEKREDNLVRSQNKMMRKLEGISKGVAKVLDPRNVGATFMNPLKMLFIFMGFHLIRNNWRKIIEKFDEFKGNIAGFIKDKFGWEWKDGHAVFHKEAQAQKINNKIGPIADQIVKAFGGDPWKGDTIGTLLERFFIGGKGGFYGILTHMKDYFNGLLSERSAALKDLKFPEIGKYFDVKNGKHDFFNAIKDLFGYLGNVSSVVVGGYKGLSHIKMQEFHENENKHFTDNLSEFTSTVKTSNVVENDIEDISYRRNTEKKLFEDLEKLGIAGDSKRRTDKFQTKKALDLKRSDEDLSSDNEFIRMIGSERYKYFTDNGYSFIKKNSDDTFTIENLNGDRYKMTANTKGRLWESGVIKDVQFVAKDDDGYVNNRYLETFKGNLITFTDKEGKVIKGDSINFSSMHITTTALGTEILNVEYEISVYSQIRQLISYLGNNDPQYKLLFASGLNRLINTLDNIEEEEYVMVGGINTLKTFFKLTQEEINSAGELYRNVNYVQVKRKITVAEAAKMAESSPEKNAVRELVNRLLWTNGPLSSLTFLGDLCSNPAWGGLGAASTVGMIRKGVNNKVFGKGAESLLRRGAGKVLLKVGLKGLLRFIPGVGTALIAWDVFWLAKTLWERSNANTMIQTVKAYHSASEVLRSYMRYMVDTIKESDIDFSKQIDSDRKAFDLILLDRNTQKELPDLEAGSIAKSRFVTGAARVSWLKNILKTKFKYDKDEWGKFDNVKTWDDVKDSGSEDFIGHASTLYDSYNSESARENLESGEVGRLGDIKNADSWGIPLETLKANHLQTQLSGETSKAYQTNLDTQRDISRKLKKNDEAWANMRTQANLDEAYSKSLGGATRLLGDKTSMEDKIKVLRNVMYAKGISKDNIDAIIANLIAESGLDPKAHSKDGGYGIAQWTDGEYENAKHALWYINQKRKARGESELESLTEASFDEQLDALLNDGDDKKNPYNNGKGMGLLTSAYGKAALKKMSEAASVEDKITAFMDEWEKPWASGKEYRNDPNKVYGKDANGNDMTRTTEINRRQGKYNDKINGFGVNYTWEKHMGDYVADAQQGLTDGVNWAVDKSREAAAKGEAYVKEQYEKFKVEHPEVAMKFEEWKHKYVDGAADKLRETAEETRDNIAKTFKKKYVKFSLAGAGKELSDYDYYLRNPGTLRPGMSYGEWEDEVHAKTGFFPSALGDLSKYKFKPEGVSEYEVTPEDHGGIDKIIGLAAASEQAKREQAEEARKKAEEEAKMKKEDHDNIQTTAESSAATAAATATMAARMATNGNTQPQNT